MNFGVITQGDIATELASRGISMEQPGAIVSPALPVISPYVPPPDAPERPITILPIDRTDIHYEPYIPIFPPPTVTPEDVAEEIVPFVPVTTEVVETGGLDKGLLVLVGITAFALMALAKPKPPQKRTRGYTRRRYG